MSKRHIFSSYSCWSGPDSYVPNFFNDRDEPELAPETGTVQGICNSEAELLLPPQIALKAEFDHKRENAYKTITPFILAIFSLAILKAWRVRFR